MIITRKAVTATIYQRARVKFRSGRDLDREHEDLAPVIGDLEPLPEMDAGGRSTLAFKTSGKPQICLVVTEMDREMERLSAMGVKFAEVFDLPEGMVGSQALMTHGKTR